MNIKLALATIGVSLLAISAANAQTVIFTPGTPTAVVGEFGPGTIGLSAELAIQGAGTGEIFVSDANLAFGNDTGYTVFSDTLIDLGLLPLKFSNAVDENNVPIDLFSYNGGLQILSYDNTAQSTDVVLTYQLFNQDPFGIDPTTGLFPTPVGTASGTFRIVLPGTVVPEPGTIALLVGMGVAGLAIRRRRK